MQHAYDDLEQPDHDYWPLSGLVPLDDRVVLDVLA